MYGSLLLFCLAFPGQVEVAADPPEAPAGAQDSTEATEKLAATTKRLVQQLNAKQASKREEAEAALVELGPDVLSLLPAINARTPAEVKERLGRVRSTLETAIATSAAKPSRVTLKGEMSLASALQALEKQTENRVSGYEERGGTVTVDFDNVLYWRALDEILDQVGLTIEEYGGEPGVLVLKARGEAESDRAASATYRGIFRFEPVRLESRRDLRNSAVNALRVTVSVAWEPRIKPISLRQAIDSLSITADEGDAIAIETARGALNASVESGVSAVELVLPLSLPSRDVKQIKSLKGTLSAMVPGSVQSFRFGGLDKARDVEMRNAGVTVTLERVRKNVDLYDVYVLVTYDEANNALESHRGWIFTNEAYLIDENGVRVTNVGLRGTRQGKNEAGVAYLFPVADGIEGYTFVYKTPALILNLPVAYELKNIQLP